MSSQDNKSQLSENDDTGEQDQSKSLTPDMSLRMDENQTAGSQPSMDVSENYFNEKNISESTNSTWNGSEGIIQTGMGCRDDPAVFHSESPSNISDSNFSVISTGNDASSRVTQETDQLMRLLVRGQTERLDEDTNVSSALKRRLRDFRFAQKKRQEKYGRQHPWGLIGLYDHLSGIRTDVEWAEDAAWRRDNNEPYLAWTDFDEAKESGLNRPFFTYSFMLVCTVCLVVSIGVNDWTFEPINVNFLIGPSAETLIAMGAMKSSLIVEGGQWFRLLTPMFLHAGIIHYVMNMLSIWFIGYAVEQSHGFVASAILFIFPAIGGTIASAIFLSDHISVGASGAIFGLIGACMADIFSNWNLLFSQNVNATDGNMRFRHIKVLVWLFVDIFLNILTGLTPFVDNFTHMGGLIIGFLCGLSTMERLSKAFFGVEAHWFSRFQVIFMRFLGMIMSVILILVSVIILYNGDGNHTSCRGCRYVSCVPFPFWVPQDKRWWYCDDCHMVTADARQHKETGYYSSLNLTCPDGEIEYVDLSGQQISDKVWLRKRLPKYCREHCDGLYSN